MPHAIIIKPFHYSLVILDDDLKQSVDAVFGQNVSAFAVEFVSLIVECSVAGLAVRVAESVGVGVLRWRNCRRDGWRRQSRLLQASREVLGRTPVFVTATVERLMRRRNR